MSNEITENKVVYNKENCNITTWCKIEGIYLHLKTPAQKLVWMNHVTERDKVFIKDSNILIGVGTDTENVIAYIKGDEYDKAFVSAAIWHHACEEFKNSLVGEGVTPDEDYAVLWVTNEALLIGDNDRYSPIVAPIGAHVAAKQLGVYIPASYQASYRDSLVAAKKYIAHGIKEWVDDPFKDAMSNWYLWGATFSRGRDRRFSLPHHSLREKHRGPQRDPYHSYYSFDSAFPSASAPSFLSRNSIRFGSPRYMMLFIIFSIMALLPNGKRFTAPSSFLHSRRRAHFIV